MVLILKGAEQDVDEAIRGADAGVDSVMFTKCYIRLQRRHSPPF